MNGKPVRKKIKASKGAELKLEHPSSLKAKARKAAFDNMMIHDNPNVNRSLADMIRKRKVDNAFKVSKKRKPKGY